MFKPNYSFQRTRCARRPVKLLVLAIAVLVSGCAAWRAVNPERVTLTVLPPTKSCSKSGTMIPVVVEVRNNSSGIVRLPLEETKFPYVLNWLGVWILKGASDKDIAWDHEPYGDGDVPLNTLHIGPGDRTKVVVNFYDMRLTDRGRIFRVRLRDDRGAEFTSKSFTLCPWSSG